MPGCRRFAEPSSSVTFDVATRIRPPPPIASRAFVRRLMTIWSKCVGSILIAHTSDWSAIFNSMSSPMSRESIPYTDVRAVFGFSPTAAAVSFLAKASSCRTICAPRRPASQIDCSNSYAPWSVRVTSRASSADPMITQSALLKSCATPPASRPTASIFCACVSWAWRCSRSASACFLAVMSTCEPSILSGLPPSSMSSDACERIHRYEPSLWRKRNSTSKSCRRFSANARTTSMIRSRSSE